MQNSKKQIALSEIYFSQKQNQTKLGHSKSHNLMLICIVLLLFCLFQQYLLFGFTRGYHLIFTLIFDSLF